MNYFLKVVQNPLYENEKQTDVFDNKDILNCHVKYNYFGEYLVLFL